MKNKNLAIVIYGFLSWLLPFVFSFFFFSKSGTLTIDYDLFKSIMSVFGTGVGLYLLALYFKKFPKLKTPLREGLVVGLTWFVLNVVLDLLVLVKGFHMPLQTWVNGVGVRYLLIIVSSACVGWMFQKK